MSEEIKQNNVEIQEKKDDSKSKFSLKKILIGSGIILTTGIGIYSYYLYNKIYPSTDNAYVYADFINVAPKVGGYIETVYVSNNQFVHKGDKLVQIDPVDYKLQVAQAEAQQQEAFAQLSSAKQQKAIAEDNLVKAKSSLVMATEMATRYNELYKEGAGSQQDAQKYSDQETQALKAVSQTEASIAQAELQIEIAQAHISAANITVSNGNLNLGYTTIKATSDGYVSNLKLYKGQLVAPGQPLFGFVDSQKWWINANFKETDLNRIKPGQEVDIDLDMYSHSYKGKVESISFATGSVFSLLPPENATGNWVKVTQRFPVKILIENDPKYPLRMGASAFVKIDTL